jgi:hypothetical protein
MLNCVEKDTMAAKGLLLGRIWGNSLAGQALVTELDEWPSMWTKS